MSLLVLSALAAAVLALFLWPRAAPDAGVTEYRSPLQTVRYPSGLGAARVETTPLVERVIIGASAEQPEGTLDQLTTAMRLGREGSLFFEVRGFASEQERDAVMLRDPYLCEPPGGATKVAEAGELRVWQTQRSWWSAWLPEPAYVCGMQVEGPVVLHVSGFLAEHMWQPLQEPIVQMLRTAKVDWKKAQRTFALPADGCRLRGDHEPPLYVQYTDEGAADRGVLDAASVRWVDLPFGSDDYVKRFNLEQLDEVASNCREAELTHRNNSDPKTRDDTARDVLRLCSPLMITLEHLYPKRKATDVLQGLTDLPRPLTGRWSHELGAAYVPARCPDRTQTEPPGPRRR